MGSPIGQAWENEVDKMGLALTHFELRVLLVYYEETTLATYDLAICRPFF